MVLGDKEKQAVKEILSPMESEVNLVFIRSNHPTCKYCDTIQELLEDISSVAPKFKYEVREAPDEEYGIDQGPVMLFREKPNVRYLGIPSGHEFRAFLDTILDVSRGGAELDVDAARKIAKVKEPVHIMVFITPTCPYCPLAVRAAHRFAIVNPNIRAEMVEALEYSDLADEWKVMAVPKNVILGKSTVQFEGAVPDPVFAEAVLRAYQGEEFSLR